MPATPLLNLPLWSDDEIVAGATLTVEHRSVLGFRPGLEPGQVVAVQARDARPHWAEVVHVQFTPLNTVYHLAVRDYVPEPMMSFLSDGQPGVEKASDMLAMLCEIRRDLDACAETCSTCSLNADTADGWALARMVDEADR